MLLILGLPSSQTFHVWNDVWLRRADLASPPSAFDGWQAIDATPQERSGGRWQMGPASVKAVFAGHKTSFDSEFVIAEVNADVRSWTRSADDSEWQLSNVDATKVGSFLLTYFPSGGKLLELPGNSTKLPDCVNVMPLYKNAEGSSNLEP